MEWLKAQWRINISELEKQNRAMIHGHFSIHHNEITDNGIVNVDDTEATVSRNTCLIAEYTAMLEAHP